MRATAAGLLAAMPELGGLDAKAVARVRRLLYMAAVAAARHNPDLGRKYRDLIGRGKPPKVALGRRHAQAPAAGQRAAAAEPALDPASRRRADRRSAPGGG